MSNTRVGIGYDIHRLVKGRKLILGGVHIPFPLGLDGHSDADCLTHSIIDALLGATNKGDIGKIFGIDKPETKGISSLILLKKVWDNLKKDYKIINIDTVIVAEKPKLSEYLPKMKENIAKILKIKKSQISIKSTTSKGLGEIGKSKAIASFTVIGTDTILILHKQQV
ncbi:MAG: 2-C-methyl-D-erythritol 2,4-cyclodiphosphate synthase [Candidatus Firestonebacteria bacterium]